MIDAVFVNHNQGTLLQCLRAGGVEPEGVKEKGVLLQIPFTSY
jgi:hypothetical protein